MRFYLLVLVDAGKTALVALLKCVIPNTYYVGRYIQTDNILSILNLVFLLIDNGNKI